MGRGQDLERLARRFFGSYADGDLEAARSLMAEDAVSYARSTTSAC